MKKLIMIFLMVMMFLTFVVALTPRANEKEILEEVYTNDRLGMNNIREYTIEGEHVVIEFVDTDFRMISNKEKFVRMLNNER